MTRQEIESALALERQGRPEDAMTAYRGILARQPQNAEALSLLGLAHARRGEMTEAIACLQQAKALRPTDASAAFNLGVALLSGGAQGEAIGCFLETLRIDPGFVSAKLNLAALYLGEGRAAEALPLLDDAIARGKVSASTWVNRGIALDLLYRPLEACAAFERATGIDPKDLQARLYLGRAYAAIGNMGKARTTYERVLQSQPENPEALLRLATAQLEVVYETEENIEKARGEYRAMTARAYESGFKTLAAAPLAHLQRIFDWPFYLPYQGQEVKDDLMRLGDAVCSLTEPWSPPPAAAVQPGPRRDRLRLGVATAFFWRHSVWKVPTKGWLANLDRSRFEIVAYNLGTRVDEETDHARALCDEFHTGEKDLAGWIRRISDDRPDVLLYPEIGMDRPTALLASLRLAPLQVTTWGHPVTSGLRTIDWYLSSDLMEPPNGETHYRERLIRLENLSVFYDTPPTGSVQLSRRNLGITDAAVVYLCCQNLSKYLPQNDDVLVSIAKSVPNSVFLFINSGKPAVDERFQRRLQRAFNGNNLQFDRHVRIVPPVSPDAFAALGAVGDVYLDSLEWSGCNTTLEMMGSALPIVTLPGRFMRGRHTSAMLQMMGLEEQIASSVEDYIGRAIELGQTPALRALCSAAIRQRRDRLFLDRSPVDQLATLLLKHCDR